MPLDFDLSDALKIDENALDVEWMLQPELYRKVSEAFARSKDRVRRLEERLKIRKAELTLKAVKNALEIIGTKATKDNIEAYYRTDTRHEELKKDWLDAMYEQEMLEAAQYSVLQRKTALENLNQLQARNYFASPREPRNLTSEMTRRQERDADRLRDRMKSDRSARFTGSVNQEDHLPKPRRLR